MAYAQALAQTGDRDGANEAARDAWTTRILAGPGEATLLGAFPGAFRPEDYDKRMDMLLWRGVTSAAQRIDPYISPAKRPLLDARLAFLINSHDAAGRDSAASASDRSDPGFIAARAAWLINTRQLAAARQ